MVTLAFGGVVGASGMTMAVVADQTPCFRCLLGELPEPGSAPTAATAGILHSTTAVVAALQCTFALRLLTGSFAPRDEVLCVDVWEHEFTWMTVPRRPDCPACGLAALGQAVPKPLGAPVIDLPVLGETAAVLTVATVAAPPSLHLAQPTSRAPPFPV